MLSNKCKYAIRAVLFLAVQRSPQKRFNTKDIATELKIPEAFLGKILQDLARKKIISSNKGPCGGFYLSEKELCPPLIQIIEVIDGLSFFNSCIIGLENCSDNHPCPVHTEFRTSRKIIENLFRNKNISQVSEEIAASDLFLVG